MHYIASVRIGNSFTGKSSCEPETGEGVPVQADSTGKSSCEPETGEGVPVQADSTGEF